MPCMSAQLMTAETVAGLLAIHPSSVRKLAASGDLAFYLVGKRMRFSEEQVDEYLCRNERRQASVSSGSRRIWLRLSAVLTYQQDRAAQ